MDDEVRAVGVGAVRMPVTSEHHIGLSRLRARAFADEAGCDEVETSRLVTSVSELASNLWFHAHGRGSIILALVVDGERTGITVLAEDDGPGIPDVNRALEDGFSTRGGLGSGLPSVVRMMDEFEISSEIGVGTRIETTLWRRERTTGLPR